MFGYVTVWKPEMKVKEFEVYNAVYCGLCREMGRRYGALSKFCLSYDLTFISLLSIGMSGGFEGAEQRRCRVNPLKKCTFCKNDGRYQRLAAAAGVALTDAKLSDNIEDSGFFGRLLFRFLRLFTARCSKKAYRDVPELKCIIEDYLTAQRSAENDPDCSLDKAAEPTAKAIAAIAALVTDDKRYKSVLSRAGYCLGKWIYLCDVADDIEKDIKKGNFNPIKAEAERSEAPKKYAEERLQPVMNMAADECRNYFSLPDLGVMRPMVDNILNDGLWHRQQKIFKEE